MSTTTTDAPPARLKLRYFEEIRPALVERFEFSSSMQAPKLEKITLNMGVGLAKQDSKVLKAATEQLATIAGQQPSVRRARKSIAAFKLREGMPVGVSVTLRGERAYEFLDRLVSVAIPRIRDFRGLNPRSFDGRGNYSMGVKEQIIFPEIDYDAIDQVRGLDITITTSATGDVEAYALLQALGMPFATQGRPRGFDPAADAADADGSTDRQGASTKAAAPSEASSKPAGPAAAEQPSDEAEPKDAAEAPEPDAAAEPETSAAETADEASEPEPEATAEASDAPASDAPATEPEAETADEPAAEASEPQASAETTEEQPSTETAEDSEKKESSE
jgi:large subunit ribosomal protein L5